MPVREVVKAMTRGVTQVRLSEMKRDGRLVED